MADLITTFGHRLRTTRKSRGLTLEQLGSRANLGYKHIAEIERGLKVPSFEAIERLASALGVRPYELFLPEPGAAPGSPLSDFKIMTREVERHGSDEMKAFLAATIAAALQFERLQKAK